MKFNGHLEDKLAASADKYAGQLGLKLETDVHLPASRRTQRSCEHRARGAGAYTSTITAGEAKASTSITRRPVPKSNIQTLDQAKGSQKESPSGGTSVTTKSNMGK